MRSPSASVNIYLPQNWRLGKPSTNSSWATVAHKKRPRAVDRFISDLRKAKIDHAVDQKDDLIAKLTEVLSVVQGLLSRLEGDDPPPELDS